MFLYLLEDNTMDNIDFKLEETKGSPRLLLAILACFSAAIVAGIFIGKLWEMLDVRLLYIYVLAGILSAVIVTTLYKHSLVAAIISLVATLLFIFITDVTYLFGVESFFKYGLPLLIEGYFETLKEALNVDFVFIIYYLIGIIISFFACLNIKGISKK